MQSIFDLTGKTALVTGASSGLGWRFAEVLSKAGARVIVAARREERLKELVNQILSKGAQAELLLMDISSKESVKAAISKLISADEHIDILVNDAAIAKATPVFEPQESNEFEKIIQTNLLGVWYVTQIIANHMKESKIEGSIINIASVNGANKLGPEFSAYCASKAAVMQLTKALVGELASHKIRINCIVPGLFHTPMTDYKLNDETKRKELEKIIPLGFFAKPEDLDGTMLLLASNRASRYITGSHFTVDGGISWGG